MALSDLRRITIQKAWESMRYVLSCDVSVQRLSVSVSRWIWVPVATRRRDEHRREEKQAPAAPSVVGDITQTAVEQDTFAVSATATTAPIVTNFYFSEAVFLRILVAEFPSFKPRKYEWELWEQSGTTTGLPPGNYHLTIRHSLSCQEMLYFVAAIPSNWELPQPTK
jgi:hypothetical protein